MTDTQVAYWNMKENQRHNFAGESENRRHNVVSEDLNLKSVSETVRHNKATEKVARSQAKSQRIQANASKSQAASAAKQARSGQLQAAASLQSASAALANAAVNRMNAVTNAKNARINAKNAKSKAKEVKSSSALKRAQEEKAYRESVSEYQNQILNDYNIDVAKKTKPARVIGQWTGAFGNILSGASTLVKSAKGGK